MFWKDLREGALFASEALCAYNKIFQLGRLELESDLQNAEPYDHEHRKGEYRDKNRYFNRTNALGISLLRLNATGFSKMYYWLMLNMITDFENDEKKPLNKGMVCANLGVSSLAEGDLDGGIAYLACAMREDRAWINGNQENNIFASPLYTQFTEGTNRGGISQFGEQAPWIMLRRAFEEYTKVYTEEVNLSSIFKELEDSPEHRALFEGALWTIHRNLSLMKDKNYRKIYKDEENIYTSLRLFDGIINLCRFIELRMKHHESMLKILTKKDLKKIEEGTLGLVLITIFGKGWYKKEVSSKRIPRFTSASNFNNFLGKKLNGKSSHNLSFLLLLVIRNYSIHLCDPTVPVFFEKLEQIFQRIIGAYIYYLKFRKLV